MYMIFSVLCQIFICICYSLALYYMAVTILDRKPEKRCYLIFCITFTLMQVVTNLIYASVSKAAEEHAVIADFVWNIVLYSLYAAILSVLLIQSCHTKAGQTAAAAAISHFVVFTVTLIAAEFMAARVSTEGNFILFMVLTNVLPHVLGLTGAFLISNLIKRWGFCQYFSALFANSKRTAMTVVCCIVLMHYHTLAEIILPVDAGSATVTMYSGTFIIVMLFVLQFAAVHTADKEKIKAQGDIIMQLQSHLELLEELQQEVRAFRHDFINLMEGTSLRVADGDLKGIQEFMQSTGAYFDEKLGNEIRQLESISNIRIYPLRSLITTKIARMQEEEISYILEVPNQITECGMRTEDLLRCLGIIMDNAREASAGSVEKSVKVILLQGTGEFYAVVSNSCAGKPNLAKMQEEGYSSKGRGRGTGLLSLRRITGEYPNCVTRMRAEEKLFTQEMRIKF